MHNKIIRLKEKILITNLVPSISTFEEYVQLPIQVQITRYANNLEYKNDSPYNISLFGYESLESGLITNAGGDLAWKLIRGDALTAFSNANTHLGVGDSTTAAAVGQTDLQAASNKFRKTMDSGYPKVNGDSGGPSARQMSFRSTYASSEANFDWREFGVFNASSSGTMLDRFVSTQGTKATTQVWQLDLTITLS